MKKMILSIKANKDLSEVAIKEAGRRIKERNPGKFDAVLIRAMAGAISSIISQMPVNDQKKREVFRLLVREMTSEFELMMDEENEKEEAEDE